MLYPDPKQLNVYFIRNTSALNSAWKRQMAFEKDNLEKMKCAVTSNDQIVMLNTFDRQTLEFLYKVVQKVFQGKYCRIDQKSFDILSKNGNNLKEVFSNNGHLNRISKRNLLNKLSEVSKLNSGQVFNTLLTCFEP